EMIDCLSALIKANEQAGRPGVALRHLDRLAALLRANRESSLDGLLAWSIQSAGRPESLPAALRLQEESLRRQVAEIAAENVTIEMFERLAVTADLKEDASGEHGFRVGVLAHALANKMGWDDVECEGLEL